jgi:hypothetical protein
MVTNDNPPATATTFNADTAKAAATKSHESRRRKRAMRRLQAEIIGGAFSAALELELAALAPLSANSDDDEPGDDGDEPGADDE